MSIRYRSLIRIMTVTPKNLWVIVPAWIPNEPICLQTRHVPEEIINSACLGQIWFHAKVNLEVATAKDLIFTDWEVY